VGGERSCLIQECVVVVGRDHVMVTKLPVDENAYLSAYILEARGLIAFLICGLSI